MDQKPSVGRIVHYYPSESLGGKVPCRGCKAQPWPAIITHVWDNGLVNLRIMDDALFSLGHPTATPAMARVLLGDPETTRDRSCWCWPPRV
jgi:hypothetical protein